MAHMAPYIFDLECFMVFHTTGMEQLEHTRNYQVSCLGYPNAGGVGPLKSIGIPSLSQAQTLQSPQAFRHTPCWKAAPQDFT